MNEKTKDATYTCRDCGCEVRVKAVEHSLSAVKLCPQCYTKSVLEYSGGGVE